ncbi:hypothetical protein MLD38_030339 [Melastoma candidum]|uniref:Uncharacterized protein n=1 Tax=Melastoma candidum TaxID=119954 RepID=A0ACB9ML38_9MYRT|nr:hypothetical protein MLD38_030339 [Melastoma candidum]
MEVNTEASKRERDGRCGRRRSSKSEAGAVGSGQILWRRCREADPAVRRGAVAGSEAGAVGCFERRLAFSEPRRGTAGLWSGMAGSGCGIVGKQIQP